MHKIFSICVLAMSSFLMPAKALSQTATGAAAIKIQGEGIQSFTLGSSDIKPAQVQEIRRKEHDGANHVFSGISLADILSMGGLSITGKVKGKLLRNYVLVEAADGYKAVFSLAELDTAFSANKIILASKMDGKALAADKGPFQVIVQDDKKLARCVRMVTSITVKNAAPE